VKEFILRGEQLRLFQDEGEPDEGISLQCPRSGCNAIFARSLVVLEDKTHGCPACGITSAIPKSREATV
jgi:hypothetical protein